MKKVKANLTLLFNYENGLHIKIEDSYSGLRIIDLDLVDPVKVLALLSRQGHVKCECKVNTSEDIGMVRIHDSFEFTMPDDTGYEKQKKEACRLAKEMCPEGWIPSMYFGSQSSFTYKDGKTIAKCGIYKYVDPESEEGKQKLSERLY